MLNARIVNHTMDLAQLGFELSEHRLYRCELRQVSVAIDDFPSALLAEVCA